VRPLGKLVHSPFDRREVQQLSKIHSMTAFARESDASELGVVTVELRTVNHRYLDCTFKLPDSLRPLESRLRERAGKALSRGKLDCFFRVQAATDSSAGLEINTEQLDRVLTAVGQVAQRLEQAQPLNPLQILQFPGVCSTPEGTDEALQAVAATLFDRALDTLADNRQREGASLAALVLDRIEGVAAEVAATRAQLPALMQAQRDRLIARINDLELDADPGRLEQELVYMAQKADVAEELDRLETHVTEIRRILEKGGPCGRRLDFLMQELNREANTLSSKSNASSTTQSAVELKVLIEQMREQIQNIE
jgi:uncharacterized protein (TIGR00255 family)